jgi:endonuclease YncB( thermonuclease family)
MAWDQVFLNNLEALESFVRHKAGKLGQSFSGKMAFPQDPFGQSVIFDVETTGIEKGARIWEASIHDVATGKTRSWKINPSTGKGGPMGLAEFEGLMEEWMSSRYKGSSAKSATLKRSVQESFGKGAVSERQFVTELMGALKGKQVLIANAAFESRMMGELIQRNFNPEEMKLISAQFQTAPATSKYMGNVFYPTGRNLQEARGQAFRSGKWGGVTDAMVRQAQVGQGTRVADILDVGRSVFERAQRLGLMEEVGGTRLGTSVSKLGLAYEHIYKSMGAETHRAADDVVMEARLLRGAKTGPGMLQSERLLRRMEGGFVSALHTVLTEPELPKVFGAMERLSTVRRGMKQKAIERAFAEAKLKAGKDSTYEVASAGRRSWQAPIMEFGSPVTSTTPISVSKKIRPANYAQAVEELTRIHAPTAGDIDIGGIARRVGQMGGEDLRNLMHTGVGFEAAEKETQATLRAMDKARPWNRLRSLGTVAKAYKFQSAAVALGALAVTEVVTGAMFSLLSSDKNDRLVREGLDERGMAAQNREEQANFGSGWLGIISSIWGGKNNNKSEYESKFRRWKRTVWQDAGRRQVMQQSLKDAEKRAQEKLGLLDISEATIISGMKMGEMSQESGGQLFEGMNNFNLAKDVALMDISPDKYNYEFDDADTLVLRKKGLLGISTGKPISIRLTGLDAPEVTHKDDPLGPVRIGQAQPHGAASAEMFESIIKSQGSLTLAYDPKKTTYGRHVGVLFGDDNTNINLELVRQGAASHLPFGRSSESLVSRKAFQEAEDFAYRRKEGMWAQPQWQMYRTAMESAQTRVTFNTLTRMDKMVKNQSMEDLFFALATVQDMGYVDGAARVDAAAIGSSMRGGWKRRGPKGRSTKQMKTIQKYGFQHGGMASASRPNYGWGSGFLRKLPPVVARIFDNAGIEWRILNKRFGGSSREGTQAWLTQRVKDSKLGVMKGTEHRVVKPGFFAASSSFDLDPNRLAHLSAYKNKPWHGERINILAGPDHPHHEVIQIAKANQQVVESIIEANITAGVRTNLSTASELYWSRMARETHGEMVPQVLGHLRTPKAEYIINEFAGGGAKEALQRGLISGGQVDDFIGKVIKKSELSGLWHADLHINQITVSQAERGAPRQLRLIDWGSVADQPNFLAEARLAQQHRQVGKNALAAESYIKKQQQAVAQQKAAAGMLKGGHGKRHITGGKY